MQPEVDGGSVFGPAFSPNGQMFAMNYGKTDAFPHGLPEAEREYGVMVFHRDGRRAAKLVGHLDSVRQIRWVDDNRLVSAAADGFVCVWQLDPKEANGGRQINEFSGHVNEVNDERIGSELVCADISSDGRLAVSGDASGNVLVWEVDSCKLVREVRKVPHLAEDDDPVHVVRFFPDGRRVVFGSHGGQVEVYDVATGELVAASPFLGMPGVIPPQEVVRGMVPEVNKLDVSPDGRLVAFVVNKWMDVRKFSVVKVLDVTTGKVLRELSEEAIEVDGLRVEPGPESKLGIMGVFFVRNGKHLLLPLGYRKVAVWDPQLGD